MKGPFRKHICSFNPELTVFVNICGPFFGAPLFDLILHQFSNDAQSKIAESSILVSLRIVQKYMRNHRFSCFSIFPDMSKRTILNLHLVELLYFTDYLV